MLRKAKIKDVPEIVRIINFYAEKGEMLSRAQSQVYNALRDYIVVEQNGQIVGCGALHVIWNDLGEIRSMAIAPERIRQGLGRRIVECLVEEAKSLDLPRVFTLTYKPEFFEKLSFVRVDKKELPHKVWKDCLNCPKFPDCDEVALIRPAKGENW
jgi:amino-acid N-acetyltransferase